ncbi:MAG: helix-turn-helix transcriptional regulator [Chloroflexi bacterium]|nr:helix-turn-helix transcriptional regulator [Chloroflexota bacterium]
MVDVTQARRKICPVDETAKIIGNKWTPLIIRDLVGGHKRFNQLERSLEGISPKTLSERLRRLEAERIVTRRCFAEVPPRVEYALTDKGHALVPVIDSMRAYGLTWLCPPRSSAPPPVG